jgi:hypothetical protein
VGSGEGIQVEGDDNAAARVQGGGQRAGVGFHLAPSSTSTGRRYTAPTDLTVPDTTPPIY